MDTEITDCPDASDQVIKVLTHHLPYSLPLLRRLRFSTPTSRVLSTFASAPSQDFLAAYVDVNNCPETEIWIYSSIEHPDLPSNEAVCEDQVLKLFARVREIERTFPGQRKTPGVVLVATLHEQILRMLEKRGLVRDRTEEHTKLLFKRKDVPAERSLPDGLRWSEIRPSDLSLVLSRTTIPYQPCVTLLRQD
jgi:hypothetical protein